MSVFFRLPRRDSFGSVESVKAASDVYAPVGGEVVEINEVRSFNGIGVSLTCGMKRGFWFEDDAPADGVQEACCFSIQIYCLMGALFPSTRRR